MNQSVETIFHAARAKSDPAERAGFLDGACGGNVELRVKVEALLMADAEAGSFLHGSTEAGRRAAAPEQDPDVTVAQSPDAFRGRRPGMSEAPGLMIGPYKLLQQIGEGGFGAVFMAQQEQPVRRRVALKIIKLGMDTRQVVARFEQERQALAILDHPNIAKVFDAGATEMGRPYFVMELCTGEPIDAYCDRNNLSIDERLELFAQVCSAVQHAHTKGLIHRDIKPGNVLVTTQDGKPSAKVIDFGIAKATSAQLTEKTLFTEHRQMIGTPQYMSPEQAEGSLDIDTRTDVYSLGVLLYELLTGSTPFDSRELRSAAYAEIQRIIREVDPPRPSTRLTANSDTIASVAARRRTEPRRLGTIVRGELDWIVMKALEKDRQRRYESANGLAADIRRYLAGEAVLAAPPSRAYRMRKFVARNRGTVVAGGLVATALLLGIIGTSLGMVQANRAAESERTAKQQADHKRLEAEKNLAFAKNGNQILGSVFTNLDPQMNFRSVGDFRTALANNLDSAVKQLDGSTIGDPVDVAEMQNTLGRSLQRLGDPRRAIPLFEKALATFASALGPHHSDTLDAANNLAVAYLDLNRPDLALPLLEEAQKGRETTLGLDAPTTIAGMRNLAGTYFSSGNLERAEEIVTQARDRALATLGPDHAETLLCATSLASVYIQTERLELAVTMLEDTLKRQKATVGPDHPDAIHTQHTLANALGAAGRGDRALPLLEDALDRAKSALGEDNLQTVNIMCQLGTIYWGSGRARDAIPLFERALVQQERLLGRDNAATLSTIGNLGVNYKDTDRLNEAIPLLEEAMNGADKHPDLSAFAPPLLEAYLATGELAKAVPLLDAALADARKELPADSPELASMLARLGVTRLSLKQWDKAESLLRECLAIREKQQPDDWRTFNSRSMLGGALAGQDRFAEAEPLLIAGFEGLQERADKLTPDSQVRIAEAADRLVQLYTAWHAAEPDKGYDTKAAAWRSKLDAANEISKSK